MSNTNLPNFNNIYANLAESAYTDRPKSFAQKDLDSKTKSSLDSGKSVKFNYSEDYIDERTHKIGTQGGTNLPNDGIVYLQPDPTLHMEEIRHVVRDVCGDYRWEVMKRYQKGLLTDEMAGFNAYFATDTPKLNSETKETYLTIRGSDGIRIENFNDWVENDGNFALTNSYIPQAKLANEALVSKIDEIKKQAPNAKLNIAGHSLGSIVSAQSVAKFYHDHPSDLDKIGKVVLFDGPDVTKSLKGMGLSDKEIKKIGEKVTYYVSPFDMISMLNRTEPYEKQFGHVNVIVPVHFTTTFDPKISTHDFGEFQIDAMAIL